MIELVPLGTMAMKIAEITRIADTPVGTRLIFELSEVTWRGDRIRADRVGGAAADWAAVGPDGTGTLDARFTLRTPDGASIYVQLGGRVDATGGPGASPSYLSARFETASASLRWLNRTLAVGKAVMAGGAVDVELYALR